MKKRNPKDKQKIYDQRWYSKNKERVRKTRNKRRALLKNWIWEYKLEHPCVKCGESHPACLDFHHVYGKNIEISRMPATGYSIERIKEEINKCEVLCANCHRKEHYATVDQLVESTDLESV